MELISPGLLAGGYFSVKVKGGGTVHDMEKELLFTGHCSAKRVTGRNEQ